MTQQVTWVVQDNLIDHEQLNSVAFAIRNCGCNLIGATVIPFSDDVKLSVQPTSNLAIPYGSTKLTKLAVNHNWTGLFFNDNFQTSVWNANRTDMLNQHATVTTVADASKWIDDNCYKDTAPLFIRPVEDLKAFAGTVTTALEIKRWMDSTASGNFSFAADTPVSIAPVQEIQAEWRWFIAGGKIVDGSMYRCHKQLRSLHETDSAVIAEAQALADIWLPHECCVMDTALTPDGVKVIEYNCFNSSGFYDNDINKVVKSISMHVAQL